MRKTLKIKHIDNASACLASVAAYYGKQIPVNYIHRYISSENANIQSVLEAVSFIHFSAKALKIDISSLRNIPLPLILRVKKNDSEYHFVVLYKISKRRATIMDSKIGDFCELKIENLKNIWTNEAIMLAPDEPINLKNVAPMMRLFALLKPHKKMITQAFLGAMIFSLLGLTPSIYLQKIVDFVLVDQNTNMLNLLSLCMIAIMILKYYVGILKSFLTLGMSMKIDIILVYGYFRHLMHLPQKYIDTIKIGDFTARFNDASKVRNFISNNFQAVMVDVLLIIVTLLLMGLYSWKMLVIFLCAVPFYFTVYYFTNYFYKKVLRKLMETNADLQSQLVESLNTHTTIKRFNIEKTVEEKTEQKIVKMTYTKESYIKLAIYSNKSTEFISNLVSITILWLGSHRIISQEMTIGELMSFYTLVGYIILPITELIKLNEQTQDALIAIDRLYQILDLEIETSDEDKMSLTRENIGDIRFKNVCFGYGSRFRIFNNLNLTIKKASLTAIVGESGSGKTTLMTLLQNIYEINSGNIEIGDYDLKYIKRSSLRNMVSVVPQRTDLFVGTLVENIAVGDSNPDMLRIIDICKRLGINVFIEKLPDSYYSLLGEHGTRLSGGESQRVAIARALYKNAEIFILDEATSSLDSHSEQYVQRCIEWLKEKGKTVIMITHRLHTMQQADNIIVLQNGEVLETGTHNELLEKKSAYDELWKNQMFQEIAV